MRDRSHRPLVADLVFRAGVVEDDRTTPAAGATVRIILQTRGATGELGHADQLYLNSVVATTRSDGNVEAGLEAPFRPDQPIEAWVRVEQNGSWYSNQTFPLELTAQGVFTTAVAQPPRPSTATPATGPRRGSPGS